MKTKFALLIPRFLPSWLASLVMAAFFLSVWARPEWFGWNTMPGLKAAVVVEVLATFGFLLMLLGLEDPDDWVGVVYLAAFMSIVLVSAVDIVVGVLLPLHLMSRVAALRSDRTTVGSVAWGLIGTALLMGACWVGVGILPLPALGWPPSSTPQALWLEVPRLGGTSRLSFGLPAWGFLYFGALSLGAVWGLFVRLVKRTAHTSTLGAT